jgi:hypothetical protein
MNARLIIALLGCMTTFACTTYRPCSDGGDLSDLPKIKGNKECYQRPGPNGRYRNEGKFIQWHPDGSMAIEGEFRDGLKQGKWTEYDESGRIMSERIFENGVELSGKRYPPEIKGAK